MSSSPRISLVSGPIIVEDGKILLVKDTDDVFWKTCGGKVDDLSTGLRANAAREAKEEVGIDLVFIPRDPFFFYLNKKTAQEEIDIILVHFLAYRVGELKLGHEVQQAQWFDVGALPDDVALNIRPALSYFGFLDQAVNF